MVYADGDVVIDENGQRRRRKHGAQPEVSDGSAQSGRSMDEEASEGRVWGRRRRECPVPKPGGMLGELLGFHKTADEDERPPRRAER